MRHTGIQPDGRLNKPYVILIKAGALKKGQAPRENGYDFRMGIPEKEGDFDEKNL